MAESQQLATGFISEGYYMFYGAALSL